MRIIVGLLALILCSPVQAQILGLQFGTAAQVSVTCPASDGSSGAPSGTAQYPTLLSGYTKTIKSDLNCKVAGVDYYVGYPSGTVFTDWQSLSGPGITVNTTSNIVTINGVTGHTFQNVDFSLHNGAILNITNSPNTTVTNCNFGGTNYQSIGNAVIIADSTSGGLTVTDTVMDGAGAGTASTLISSQGGSTTVHYNYFKNFPQQVLSLGNANGTIDYKYNLIENGAMQSGAHLNYLQLGHGTYSITVQFNTSKQALEAGGAGEGYQFYAGVTGQATLTSPSVQYNTMIATGTNSMSYMVHGNCHTSSDCATTGSTTTSGLANNNYFDLTGAFGAFYPSGGSAMWTNWTLSNNWNMVNGIAISNSP